MDTLLDLSTKRDRPKIKIDGKLYEITVSQDLSFAEVVEMQKASERAQALAEKESLTDEEKLELIEAIDSSVKRIVRGIKKRTIKKLMPAQKVQIIQVFSKAAAGVGNSQRRGEQSPDSSDSMVATQ